MRLLDLPVEILIKIVECLIKQADINTVVRLTKTLYNLFNDFMYKYNVRDHCGDALPHGASYDHEAIACKHLDFGADTEVFGSVKRLRVGLIGR